MNNSQNTQPAASGAHTPIIDNATAPFYLPNRQQMELDIDNAIASILAQQGSDAAGITSSAAVDASPAVPERHRTLYRVLLGSAIAALILCGFFISSSQLIDRERIVSTHSAADEFDSTSSIMVSDSVSDIAELPRVYVLPLADEPAPKPNSELFGTKKDTPIGLESPLTVSYYEDETISVRCWREEYMGSTLNLSEIYIAHPSQFRRAFAGGSYESKVRYTPVSIARNVNAVVAMNADYCQYRTEGVVIHHRELLRHKLGRNLDVLLYDVDGNLHTVRDTELYSSGILDNYDIIYSFTFGPTLVDGGKVCDTRHLNGYSMGHVTAVEPRAAIGQLDGERHYLLCTVDGRTKRIQFTEAEMAEMLAQVTDPEEYEKLLEEFENPGFEPSGLTIVQFANFMHSKGCSVAYAMDGGQTATLIFNGRTYNTPAYGGQRTVSDILYFASALPEE